jgi:ArsR family transcriptional regulator, cadmium/lead-responsive transcriptional repressor
MVASRWHPQHAARWVRVAWQRRRPPRLGTARETASELTRPPPMGRAQEEMEQMAGFFGALADPACLRLLEFLAAQERTVPECAAHTSLSSSCVRQHLTCLEQHGWIERRRDGSARLTDPRAAELLLLARALAENNAGALSECLHLDRSRLCR